LSGSGARHAGASVTMCQGLASPPRDFAAARYGSVASVAPDARASTPGQDMGAVLPTVGESLRLTPELNGAIMTSAEFDAADIDRDDPHRYELVHGVLVVNPSPLPEERDPNQELGYLLRRHTEDHPQGSALDATLNVHTVAIGDNRRRADRVIWAGLSRLPDPADDLPTIVVEFVSQGRRNWRRDYEEKRDDYLAAGVAEYWVIDRFRRSMTVFRRRDDQGVEEQVVAENDVYRPPLLPGFELPLARLLVSADRWRQGDE